MNGEEEEFWVIRIPKPKRFFKALARLFGAFQAKNIEVDVPLITITSLLIAVMLFVFFTLIVKIPEAVAVVFSAVLIGLYLYILRSEMRR